MKTLLTVALFLLVALVVFFGQSVPYAVGILASLCPVVFDGWWSDKNRPL